ncbi:Spo0B domain-containing protein [Sporosarcina oncorhynchi]|uniref:Spo0B domain-containing protein n=1 Tax=Sporosarcina oncorhynchi TaxID=3056444 RepID=A0ABZ0LAX1_9BACL|nr:Spo0B domain-containing protein [Sporosarcina sp. T2O-4]WOV88744.1 Spo0B domain-containing protein [Sporosarcina sp. T2O-4]
MESEQLTIGQALKFARHDFLNELQLMLLYMDLGKPAEARKSLLDATERMRNLSKLENLRMPQTEVWLNTYEWRHPSFSKTLHCAAIPGDRAADDKAVSSYLERLIEAVEKVLDPMEDYTIDTVIEATAQQWSIQLTIRGLLAGIPVIDPVHTGFEVGTTMQDEQWTFTISGR